MGEYAMRMESHRVGAVGALAKLRVQNTINMARNILLQDPTQFQSILNEQITALSLNTQLPEQVKIELSLEMRKGMALSAVQGLGKDDPMQAIQDLSSGMWDPYIDADNKASLTQSFIAKMASDAEKARIAEERQKKVLNENAIKKLMKMDDEGNLTEEAITEAYDVLGKDEYKLALQMLRNQDPDEDDPKSLASLYEVIYSDPLSAPGAIMRAHADGKIRNATVASMLSTTQSLKDGRGYQTQVERSRRFLEIIKPGPTFLPKEFSSRQAQYESALLEFNTRTEVPGLTDEQIAAIGSEIVIKSLNKTQRSQIGSTLNTTAGADDRELAKIQAGLERRLQTLEDQMSHASRELYPSLKEEYDNRQNDYIRIQQQREDLGVMEAEKRTQKALGK